MNVKIRNFVIEDAICKGEIKDKKYDIKYEIIKLPHLDQSPYSQI